LHYLMYQGGLDRVLGRDGVARFTRATGASWSTAG
jgi:hypothetical protein